MKVILPLIAASAIVLSGQALATNINIENNNQATAIAKAKAKAKAKARAKRNSQQKCTKNCNRSWTNNGAITNSRSNSRSNAKANAKQDQTVVIETGGASATIERGAVQGGSAKVDIAKGAVQGGSATIEKGAVSGGSASIESGALHNKVSQEALIEKGAINIGGDTYQARANRIEHMQLAPAQNCIGRACLATPVWGITGQYDDEVGGSVNLGVVVPFGGSKYEVQRAMAAESQQIELENDLLRAQLMELKAEVAQMRIQQRVAAPEREFSK